MLRIENGLKKMLKKNIRRAAIRGRKKLEADITELVSRKGLASAENKSCKA